LFLIKFHLPALRRVLGERTGVHLAARNTGWLVADRLMRSGGNFLLNVWIARYLGAEQFGAYNFVLAFVVVSAGFAHLGLEVVAVRELVQSPKRWPQVLGTTFTLRLLGGALAWAAATIAVLALRGGDPETAILVAIAASGLLFQSADAVDYWFQASLRSRNTVLARNLAFVAAAVLRVGLIFAQAPLAAFVWATVAELAIAGILLLQAHRLAGGAVGQWRFEYRLARRMLREAAPLLVSSIAIAAYMRLDQVMLGQLASFSEVGVYAAATRLTELWYFIPVAVTASLFPAVVQSRQLSPDVYRGRIQAMYDLLGWMGLTLAAATSLLAPVLVDFFYGRSYAQAVPVLQVQAWLAAGVFFGVARSRWLFAEGRQRDAMYIDLVGLAINFACNLLFIPRWGAFGAALSSLVMVVGSNVLVAAMSPAVRLSLVMYARSIALPWRLIRHRGWVA